MITSRFLYGRSKMVLQHFKRRPKLIFVALAALIFYLCGGFFHVLTKDFDADFDYPYNGNVKFLVDQMVNGAQFSPTNIYYFKYQTNFDNYCDTPLELLILVKSDPEHYDNRNYIRQTWGSAKRAGRKIKTVFLIGERPTENDKLIEESHIYNDLVLGNFTDSYFNNTVKTMMGFYWAMEYCTKTTDYFLFIDDDYYLSTTNLLKFVKNPYVYPGRDITVQKYSFTDFGHDAFELYAGHVFHSSPFRAYFSKWYVSLEEYPYNKWPPYVTAGAYVLSRKSLVRMYYASLLTQHFRFDDIYVGIIAYKLGIEPIHNENFMFYKKLDGVDLTHLVASHGFSDPDELRKFWLERNPKVFER